MPRTLLAHVGHNWPLALIVAGLSVHLPFTLLKGVFYTNQGPVAKATEPGRYWNWVLGFALLWLASLAVLLGAYWLGR